MLSADKMAGIHLRYESTKSLQLPGENGAAGMENVEINTRKIMIERLLYALPAVAFIIFIAYIFLFADNAGVITDSGIGRFTEASFYAADIRYLEITASTGTLHLLYHDADTIDVRITGSNAIVRYNFNAEEGILSLSRSTASRSSEIAEFVIYMPQNTEISHIDDLRIRASGPGNGNNIIVSGGSFGNAVITALNGAVDARDASFSGDLRVTGRYGVVMRNVSFDESGASISSSQGALDIQ